MRVHSAPQDYQDIDVRARFSVLPGLGAKKDHFGEAGAVDSFESTPEFIQDVMQCRFHLADLLFLVCHKMHHGATEDTETA
jgi:hypothetical protein